MKGLKYAAGVLVFGGIVAVMGLLLPQEGELIEAQVRAGSPQTAVTLLEGERAKAPEDPALAARLAEAYERAGDGARALALLTEESRRRPLATPEKAQVKRLAFAVADPARALPVLAGPHEKLDKPDRAELVAIALAANLPAEALKHQEALLGAEPSDAQALAKARDLALAVPDMARAIRFQGRLTAISGSLDETRKLIAMHVQAGDPAGGLDVLEASPRLHEDPTWHQQAVELATWAEKPGRALPHMWALYEHAPDPKLGLTLARTLVQTRDVRALPFARRLYASHPDDAEAREHLLYQLVREQRIDAAKGLLLVDWERRPHDVAAHRRLVDFLLGTGDRSGAIAQLERWIAMHPTDRAATHRLAVVQVWDGRVDAAWNTYAHLIGAQPATAETSWRKEWLAISRPVDDTAPEARENLNVLVETVAEDPALVRRAAFAASEAGDRAEAIALGRRLMAMPGATGDDALRLAEWLMWDKQLAESFSLLRKLDAARPVPASVLREAANQAGASRRFKDAADFLARIAAREPKNPTAWTDLAHVRAAAGDLAGAAAAWQKRLALPGATADDRLAAAGLLAQLSRLTEAHTALAEADHATLPELRLKAALAFELKRPEAQEAALRALVAKAPEDSASRVALAELLAKRGEAEAAQALEDEAIALRPADATLLANVAGRRLYTQGGAAAGPVVDRLAALANPGAAGLRVIADYFQSRDPGRAGRALDQLHAAGGGDAETYFRRGEIASSVLEGAVAEEAYTEAARRAEKTDAPELREAGAYALQRLGRQDEAQAVWAKLKTDHPTRPAAYAALARQAMAEGAMEDAELILAEAPEGLETGLARADWLTRADRHEEAAAVFADLRVTDPSPYMAAAEAMARHGAGQYGQGRALVLEALQAESHPDLLAAHRVLRDKGASRAGFTIFQERYAVLERTRMGVESTQRLGDRLRLNADLSQMSWDGGRVGLAELGLAVAAEAGPVTATARVAVPQGQSPLGGVAVAYAKGAVQTTLGVDEARWEETNAVAVAAGRERRVSLDSLWAPDPRFTVRALGTFGSLSRSGEDVGFAATAVLDTTLKADPASPWFATLQYRQRAWGEAGPKVGLPEYVTTYAASVGYGERFGPLRVELQPGGVYDGTVVAPMAGAVAALELGPDRELAVNGFWSGRAFTVGDTGSYESVSVTGRWWF